MNIIFIAPETFLKAEGKIYLPERSLLGYQEYRSYLSNTNIPFTMTLVSLLGTQEVSLEGIKNLQPVTSQLFRISTEPAKTYIEKLQEPSIIYTLLKPETTYLSEQKKHKIVYLLENTLSNKWDLYRTSNNSIWNLDSARFGFGLLKNELAIIKALKNSAGVQFNGLAAANKYSRYNKNSLVFFDHRVKSLPTSTPPRTEKSESARNYFSIGFSGRLEKFKGSQYLPQLSQEVYRQDPNIKFYIMGDGSEREEVLRKAAPNLIYKGFMNYTEEWEPFVASHIDLMIFPHPQGDPSMTYYEALGQGTPIISFDNLTARSLQKQGLAWTVPIGDVSALTEKIIMLSQQPDALAEASDVARQFMAENLYPHTVAKRMDHLIRIYSGS